MNILRLIALSIFMLAAASSEARGPKPNDGAIEITTAGPVTSWFGTSDPDLNPCIDNLASTNQTLGCKMGLIQLSSDFVGSIVMGPRCFASLLDPKDGANVMVLDPKGKDGAETRFTFWAKGKIGAEDVLYGLRIIGPHNGWVGAFPPIAGAPTTLIATHWMLGGQKKNQQNLEPCEGGGDFVVGDMVTALYVR